MAPRRCTIWERTCCTLRPFGIVILPTLITRKIIFGGMFRFGAYAILPWDWRAPFWRSVLFSSDHGMWSWTPLLAFAILGLFLPFPGTKRIKLYLALATVTFFYVISSYPFWDGLASFGNRFFISLTPVFVFGLALLLERAGGLFPLFPIWLAYATQGLVVALFALWNLAFIFQWGTHMVPVRGNISWSTMVHNQFVEVPERMTQSLEMYFLRRGEMMKNIEQKDIEQQKLGRAPGE